MLKLWQMRIENFEKEIEQLHKEVALLKADIETGKALLDEANAHLEMAREDGKKYKELVEEKEHDLKVYKKALVLSDKISCENCNLTGQDVLCTPRTCFNQAIEQARKELEK